MSNKTTVGIFTLGCRVNMYESCAISERLTDLGYEVSKDPVCDYYIINTCAVTAESERKSRQIIRRCARYGKVLVIGCASQLENKFSEIENVIYVGGNREKGAVVNIINGTSEADKNSVTDMMDAPYEEMYLCGKDDFFSECRAFIKIQDGCNGKCTYCIIPKCRGNVRSRDPEKIVSEAERLVANGYNEVILTGIEVSAYNKIPLHELIMRVSKIYELKRLRLGSLSPNIINEKFLQAVSNIKSFMPHIHLSLQSCSNRILRLMKRPYCKQDIIDRIALIRKYIPNCLISADIIVGFPSESEEEFLETVQTIKELKIFHVHSFPYSERKGTHAAMMPNSIPKYIRAERNNRLISSCLNIKESILDEKLGKYLLVLIEKIIDGYAFGHTEEFLEATFPHEKYNVGEIVEIIVEKHNGAILYGSCTGKRI